MINTSSDVGVCKLLAENGIDLEEFEKTLPDSFLNQVNGGYKDAFGSHIYCPWCNNEDSDEISRQFFASLFTDGAVKYRCCKCDKYFKVSAYGVSRVTDD